jgi:hypothetical protein
LEMRNEALERGHLPIPERTLAEIAQHGDHGRRPAVWSSRLPAT